MDPPAGAFRALCIFGTRPEAIKMAPVVREFRRRRIALSVCVTGQHREMLDHVLRAFDISPDHDLSLMSRNQDLADLTGRLLVSVDGVLRETKPAVVLVQGDTTTAFAAALAAFYRRIPVAHVEAGLRTGDYRNPFPEEANRVLIDHLSTLCFAPTEANKAALLADGIAESQIHVTGNTGIDALRIMRERVAVAEPPDWRSSLGSFATAMPRHSDRIVLVTLHRRETFGTKLRDVLEGIGALARSFPDWAFVYPVHLNPNVREPAHELLRGHPNVHLVEPLPYDVFVRLMEKCSLILTDSGGIQEEAPSLGKMVVVIRERTERKEAVQSGSAVVVGNTGAEMMNAVRRLLSNPASLHGHGERPNPFGDGHAAERIVDICERAFSGRAE